MVRIGLGMVALSIAANVAAQENRPSSVPGSPPGFNHPMSQEAVTAAPLNHHVLYEDDHVRLLEVTVWPGVAEHMHGHAYPSVFASNAVQPAMTNDHPPGDGPPVFGKTTTPAGVPAYPQCMTLGPQNPHSATVTEPFPQHFYRMEFKRLDGNNDLMAHWRSWYGAAAPQPAAPQRADLAGKSAYPGAWPFPAKLEATRAAPANYRVIYADPHIRLVDVMIRPGDAARGGSPYPAVLAFDAPQPNTPGGATIAIGDEARSGAFAVDRPRQSAGAPLTWNFPTCQASGPLAPHVETNTGTVPLHYYRIEFMRIDGDAFRTNWQRWYPAMAAGSAK